jgi:hypothetical protein
MGSIFRYTKIALAYAKIEQVESNASSTSPAYSKAAAKLSAATSGGAPVRIAIQKQPLKKAVF